MPPQAHASPRHTSTDHTSQPRHSGSAATTAPRIVGDAPAPTASNARRQKREKHSQHFNQCIHATTVTLPVQLITLSVQPATRTYVQLLKAPQRQRRYSLRRGTDDDDTQRKAAEASKTFPTLQPMHSCHHSLVAVQPSTRTATPRRRPGATTAPRIVGDAPAPTARNARRHKRANHFAHFYECIRATTVSLPFHRKHVSGKAATRPATRRRHVGDTPATMTRKASRHEQANDSTHYKQCFRVPHRTRITPSTPPTTYSCNSRPRRPAVEHCFGVFRPPVTA
jgi:hypothetical protein